MEDSEDASAKIGIFFFYYDNYDFFRVIGHY
jgi:hypothetical protein